MVTRIDSHPPVVRAPDARGDAPAAEPTPAAPASPQPTGWSPKTGRSSGDLKAVEVRAPSSPLPSTSGSADRAIADAVRFGGRSVSMLRDETLRGATVPQRTEMMKALLRDLQGSDNSEYGEKEAMRATVSTLITASKTPGELDYMLSRVDSKGLEWNMSGPDRLKAQKTIEAFHKATPGDWAGYAQYLEEVTGAKSSGQNSLEFLVDGTEVSPKGQALLAGAKDSINLSVFQLEGDEVGGKLVAALSEKAKAGVKVRVLLDEYGSTSAADAPKVNEYIATLKAAGAEVIINKTPLLKDNLDHRKVLVVDGSTAFTGGMNIGDHYQREWHDQQTLVRGPAVDALQDAFFTHWKREGGTVPEGDELARSHQGGSEIAGGANTYVVTHEGQKQDRNIKAAYMKAFNTAEKTITLANPYFADEDVIKTLCNAANRGVKVQVVVPSENDMGVLKRAAAAYYPDLLKAGVEIYEYPDRMAHQKVAVVDGKWATVGSSNLDARSLEYNDEMNLVVLDEKFAGDVQKKMFDVDVAKSTRVTKADPTLRERLDRLVSPLI